MKKRKYNMWQNTGFMLRTAWQVCKSVIFLCVSLAIVTAGKNVVELLVAPSILEKVETSATLIELIATIGLFSGALLILTGLKAYLNSNTIFGRVTVRSNILRQIGDKIARTSYTNILDTEFIRFENKASEVCSSNSEATEAIWNTWTIIITNIIGFSVYLVLISDLSLWLICLVVITSVVGYYTSKFINEWGYHHREEEAEYCERMNYIREITTERVYAKDIRIFGLRTWLDDIWNSTLKTYQAFIAKREKIYIWTNVIELVLILIRNGVAYIYLIWLTLQQQLAVSEFLLYFSAVNGFTQWVTGILDKFTELHKQSLDLSTLREFLEWPESFKFEDGEPLETEANKDYEIRLEDVSFKYPKSGNSTIKHINLTIHSGEKLAIVGINGAGKSTLVKLICGFLDPTEGSVLLNGEDIRKYNRRDYYALFSAVFQDFSVLEGSVAMNVAQRVDGIDRERVWECLEKAGLEEKIQSLPNEIDTNIGRQVYEDGIELSGGEMQRLMLARALYKDAPIIILDEPTAALDPIAENYIYLKYSEMTEGRTSLFISHRMASTRFCDRILFLERGKIAEEGTHESLMTINGGYAKLFEIQSQYYQKGVGCHEQ